MNTPEVTREQDQAAEALAGEYRSVTGPIAWIGDTMVVTASDAFDGSGSAVLHINPEGETVHALNTVKQHANAQADARYQRGH